jgi:MFS transporter, ACS family, tartrate transporter
VGAASLVLLGTTRSPVYSTALLCLLAAGVCSFLGPFWALPSEFLTGFSAAAGIALINSVGNLGGLVGPYMIGAIATRTGSLYAGLAFAGTPLFLSALLAFALGKQSTSAGDGLIAAGSSSRK